jgi:hypothetical protein
LDCKSNRLWLQEFLVDLRLKINPDGLNAGLKRAGRLGIKADSARGCAISSLLGRAGESVTAVKVAKSARLGRVLGFGFHAGKKYY